MTYPPAPVRLTTITAPEFQRRVDELMAVYLAAMRYPENSGAGRRSVWVEHSQRRGFRAVLAEQGDTAIGLCYGYTGMPQQWWHSEVRRGLSDAAADSWLSDYRELTELHVRPDRQGAGLGEAMLRLMLAGAPERRVLLSTPEGENRAWRLYRRLGFQDVLRFFMFTGDPRPFAVLGRSLPLAPATARLP